MADATRYAIIDGAIEEGVTDFLAQANAPHCCLYAEPIQPELVKLAPYLVEVVPEVEAWLELKETPWGIYFTAFENINKTRQHLRKYLQVLIPDEEKPVLFRFYDPRNIWDFLSILSSWEKLLFIGPMESITTHWDAQIKNESFFHLKDQFPTENRTRNKIMQISPAQMEALSSIFEQRYIDEVVKKSALWVGSERQFSREELLEMLYWLRSHEIKDDRSIRGLLYLFYLRGYLSTESLPASYKEILCEESDNGVFKAETLLLRELGNIPV